MSEPKRVPLQTLEFPESLGHATKKEKKGEKGKQLAPSFRFTLVLPESNEKACPEFNYSQLLKAAEKKRRKEQKRTDENATNGLDPFDDDDDDDDEDKLREMAKRFEAKYGTATAGRKRHNKYDDYVDLGAGYDENDSFIDNTDAYDEIVPEEMTTAHGGFYINCGALEFKAAEGNSLVHNNNNINNNNNNNTININNEDESSESSEDDAEEAESPKRTEKRPFSTSEDDDTEDMIGDQPRKKLKLDENMEKKLNHEALIKKKKKQHQHHSQQQQQSLQPQQQSQQQQQQQQQLQQQLQQQELDALNRRKIPVVRDLLKEKRETLETEGGAEELDERKRLEKLELQKSKPTMEKKFDIKKFEKKSSSNGLDARKLDLKRLGGKDSNIDDAIESVVNAARVEDESSRETMDSGKSRGIIGSESECDDVDKEEAPLPDSLAEDVKEIVNKLKMHAENSKEGKTKFFNASVNSGLFSLEKKLRSLYTPSVRMQTYDHLAHFLPCSKITLVNRAKKLFLQDVEYRVKEPLQRLKIVIDSVMPSIMERYTKECQRVADENPQLYWEIYRYCWGIEGSPTDAESSDGDDSSNKNSDKTRIPRRRFPWNDESKKLIYEIACARRQYFEVLRPRKESMESFVAAFMDTKVRPLWPPGWVRLQTLLKYSNLEPTVKRKAKKPKDLASSTANTIVSSGTTISNSTARIDIPNANTVITTTTTAATTTTTTTCSEQERIRTPTSFSKITSVSTENNPINFTVTTKTSELNAERKQGCKYKDKNRESPMTNQHDNPIPVGVSTNSTLAKISVVPASQLMPQKARSHVEKFNPMDLTSSSLSITPVNDYQKSGKPSETKKDVVSITPYSETMANVPNVTDGNAMVSQSGHHHSVSRQEVSYSTGQMQQQQQQQQQSSSSYSLPNQSGSISSLSKPVPLKHRILQESIETKSERRTENKDSEVQHKTEKREKRRERCADGKHKSHDSKKRRKDHKVDAIAVNAEILPIVQQPLLTKEEQEQRQIEETMAATNFLSQIINDDAPRTVVTDKRKETAVVDDIAGNTLLPTEQENDVQMVMRSLKELQELQEMKYSPSHSPVGSIQKPSKSNVQYVSYQEDYQRLYHKKDDKLRLSKKDDPQW